MKRRSNPAYWQLDAFVCVMIALSVLIVRADIAARWQMLVDIGWAALVIAGMSAWVWANWPALREEERKQRAWSTHKRLRVETPPTRNVHLTPVQRRFLDAMRRHEHR